MEHICFNADLYCAIARACCSTLDSHVESVCKFSLRAVIRLKQTSLCSLALCKLELSFILLFEGREEGEELSSDSTISSVILKRFFFLRHGHVF